MRVRWSPSAEWQLYAIGDYIARDDPDAAIRWMLRLWDRAEKVGRMPRAGRKVPELARDDLREVFVKNYRIIYRTEDESVVILAVVEGHERLPTLDEE